LSSTSYAAGHRIQRLEEPDVRSFDGKERWDEAFHMETILSDESGPARHLAVGERM